MILSKHLLASACVVLMPVAAFATPSSTYWAPSTASCQAWKVPHITFDTYFGKGPGAGSAGAPNYPIDTGLTVGFLPFEKIQGEFGFDVLLPTQDPIYLNGKICTPESSLFNHSPGIGFGIYNAGFKSDVTNYNVLYGVVQETIPFIGGYVAAGAYYALNKTLMTNSSGDVVQTGFLGAIASPDIQIGLKGLKKINFVADVQTGKNVLGAWGIGSYIYFADNVSLLTGPVIFLDKALQPGGSKFLWTLQLDIDISFSKDVAKGNL